MPILHIAMNTAVPPITTFDKAYGSDAYKESLWELAGVVILMMGLVIAGIAYWQGKVLVERELASQLDLRAEEAKYSVEREVERYAELLRGWQIQFLVQPDLSRRTFRQIAHSLQLDTRLPGIQAIAFTQRIAPGTARAFEASVRREFVTDHVGYPPPVIHPRFPVEEAFVVQYVEPVLGNHAGA